MFSFLIFLLIINAFSVTSVNQFPFSSNEMFLLQEEVANLQKENDLLRNRVTKLEECDLESNITEIMRILEAHGQVSIS